MNLTSISTQVSTLTTAGTALSSGASGSATGGASGGAASLGDLTAGAAKLLSSQNAALKALDAKIGHDQLRLSGIGKLALALDGFQAVAGALAKSGLDLSASVAGTAVTAQLAGSSVATAGTHAIEVRQLAQAQQLVTRALPGHATALGAGASTVIKVDTGSGKATRTTTVTIDAGNNTLDGIAKAMKDAGLDARVTRTGDGYALTLTGQTGAANAMRIGVSGDPVLKGLLSYQPGTPGAVTQAAAAQDAQLTVDGKTVAGATNKIDAAVPGVALTLAATGKSTVTIGGDATSAATNVKRFVDAYNALNANLGALKASNPDSATTIADVRTQLAGVLGAADAATLADIGITQKNGSLALDETKLKTAIAVRPDAVGATFSNKGSGLADRMAALVTKQMGSGGPLEKQAAALDQDVTRLTGQRAKATQAIGRQATQLAQQYAAVSGGSGSRSGSGAGLFGSGSSGGTGSVFDALA